jgi:hypothetical protein
MFRHNWASRNRDRGTAMVLIEELLLVLRRLRPYLHLRGQRRDAPLVQHHRFRRQGTGHDPASAAVIADAGVDVHRHIAHIDVVDHGGVHAVHRTVIEEMMVAPIAAVVSMARVAKAIRNPAIEANMETPVSMVEAVRIVVESPIARRPESAFIRRGDPYARHPVIASRAPCPIARRP